MAIIVNTFFSFIIFFQIFNIMGTPAWAESPPGNFYQRGDIEKISFGNAEGAFGEREYDQALVLYKNYISNYPNGYFVDDSIFRLGEIYSFKKNYFMAIRYYQLLQRIDDKTDLNYEVEYKIATCFFLIEHYENALFYLESIYSKPADMKRKWEIVYLMGRTLEKMNDNLFAFNRYLNSLRLAPDEELKQKSIDKIIDMIQKKLTLDDLVHLADAMDSNYPVGFVLFRISELYESKRQYPLFQEYLSRFLNDFPEHKLYEQGREKLERFLARNTLIKTKVVSILPLSGEAAESGQKILQGIQMAFNLIPDNKKKDIELVIKDSKGSPEKIAVIIEDIGADNDVTSVIGPMFSKTAKIAIEKAEKYHLPMISPSASVAGLPDTSQYFFRNCLTQELQGKGIAEYAINKLDLSKFVMLYPSDVYGTRLKDVFLDQISSLGGEVIAGESYSPTQNDFKKQILSIGGLNDNELKKRAIELIIEGKKDIFLENNLLDEHSEEVDEDKYVALSTTFVELLKKKNGEIGSDKEIVLGLKKRNSQGEILEENKNAPEKTLLKNEKEQNQENETPVHTEEKFIFKPFLKVNYDAIFLPGFSDKVGLIAPQLAFYNIDEVQLLGGNGWNSDNVIELGGKYVTGAIFTDGFFSGSYLSKVQEFTELYEDFFGETPDILAAQAFDAANIIFNIILSGHTDREGIRNSLMKVNSFNGVSGKTNILPNGDSEKELFFISIKSNKRVQIN